MNTLQQAIVESDEIDQDIVWSLLKRQDKKFGILKKLKCMARALGLDENQVLNEAVVDESGRYLDAPNRDLIHQALMDWREGNN